METDFDLQFEMSVGGVVMMDGRVMMMMLIMIDDVIMMMIFDESVGVVHLRSVEQFVVKLRLMMSVVVLVVEPV